MSELIEKLAPCPFCGSEYSHHFKPNYDGFVVACLNCSAEGPVPRETLTSHTKEAAIAAWNQRALTAALRSAVGE